MTRYCAVYEVGGKLVQVAVIWLGETAMVVPRKGCTLVRADAHASFLGLWEAPSGRPEEILSKARDRFDLTTEPSGLRWQDHLPKAVES